MSVAHIEHRVAKDKNILWFHRYYCSTPGKWMKEGANWREDPIETECQWDNSWTVPLPGTFSCECKRGNNIILLSKANQSLNTHMFAGHHCTGTPSPPDVNNLKILELKEFPVTLNSVRKLKHELEFLN